MSIGVSKKKRFAGSDRCSRWFEGQSSVQRNYREEQGLLPLSADRSWRLDLNPRAGPTGSCNSGAIFLLSKGRLASTRDSVWLQSIYIQLAGDAGRTKAATGIVPAGAHVHLAVGDGRYREFDRVSRLITRRLRAIPQLRGEIGRAVGMKRRVRDWHSRGCFRDRECATGGAGTAGPASGPVGPVRVRGGSGYRQRLADRDCAPFGIHGNTNNACRYCEVHTAAGPTANRDNNIAGRRTGRYGHGDACTAPGCRRGRGPVEGHRTAALCRAKVRACDRYRRAHGSGSWA